MSTNYYISKDQCTHCGRSDDKPHIGKNSMGWVFLFASPDTGEKLISWQEWKDFLRDLTIVDEYGAVISYEDFCGIVESTKGKATAYNKDGRIHYPSQGKPENWETLDPEGFRFSTAKWFC